MSDLYLITGVLNTAISFSLGLFVYLKGGKPLHRYWFLMSTCVAGWAFLFTIQRLISDRELCYNLNRLEVVFSVFIAVYIGSLQVERELIDAVRAMGATPRQIFWKVVVPATASNIYAALKLGVGLALISAIAGEFIAARAGLGYMIFFATGVLDTPTLYLGIIVLALFSVALQGGVNVLGRALVRWRFHDEK